MFVKEIDIALKGNFISNRLKKYIDEQPKQINNYQNKILDLTIVDLNNGINIDKLRDEIFRICSFFRTKLINKTKKIKLYFFPTTLKKTLDFKKNSIDVEELNSACTFFYPETEFIAIYRMEEWKKVLFHELVHFYGLDSSFPYNSHMEFKNKYNVSNSPVRLAEVYAEIIGMLLNIEYSGGDLDKLMLIEKTFMTIQFFKVLDFFKVDKRTIVSDLSKLKSDSNLVTYFIFKLAFLETLNNPIEFLNEQEKHNGLKLTNPQQFMNSIDKGMKLLSQKKRVECPSEFKDTMRMTIVN